MSTEQKARIAAIMADKSLSPKERFDAVKAASQPQGQGRVRSLRRPEPRGCVDYGSTQIWED